MKLDLADLPNMHPSLLWETILAAAAAVLSRRGTPPFPMTLDVDDIPGFGSGTIEFDVLTTGIPNDNIEKAQRTYESHRMVEFAAIAVTGLVLFHAGGHRIIDVALRGSSADYLVDEERWLLEIAGRSRKSDFKSAWSVRWQRLSGNTVSGFFLSVCEFETPTGRLAFAT